jgi:hypothetical protein
MMRRAFFLTDFDGITEFSELTEWEAGEFLDGINKINGIEKVAITGYCLFCLPPFPTSPLGTANAA